MAGTAFDNLITRSLVTDPKTAALFDEDATLRAMLDVEAALALSQAECGLIPEAAANVIANVCETAQIGLESLSAGTALDGMAVPALVSELRKLVGSSAAPYVHFGATSQDILDTGLVLRLKAALSLHERALWELADKLAALADAHRATPIAARTRMQQASPTSFGLKIAGWLSAVVRNLQRLEHIRTNLLVLSFAGAAGNLSALGDKALVVEHLLANRLDLRPSPAPWHTIRDGLADYGNWLTLVTGMLGKIGTDIVLLSQNEVGEVQLGSGGGSSTLPNKVNPVAAETLIALARHNASALSTLHNSVLQEHERSGAGWTLEWLVLPQIVLATGGALATANGIFDNLKVNPEAMRANVDSSNGLLLAEAASFALACHMPRPEAQTLVKTACQMSTRTNTHLFDVLAAHVPAEIASKIDWGDFRNAAGHLGSGNALIDRILESLQELKNAG